MITGSFRHKSENAWLDVRPTRPENGSVSVLPEERGLP
jgi:hypothetical protein